jgi:chloride channel 3/4/5
MRRDIYTLRATGMTLADVGEWDRYCSLQLIDSRRKVENYVEASKVKGFPIVVDDETRTLVGYVGSHELRTAIGESIHFRSLYDSSLIVGPRPS